MMPLPMELAPRDRRILVLYWPYHYETVHRGGWKYGEWVRTPEPVWSEVHWVEPEWGDPHWEEFTGNPRCRSSNHIREEDCLAWMPVPGRATSCDGVLCD